LIYENFQFDGFDIVVSVSSRYAHHTLVKPGILHVCYLSSPGRMYREYQSYFKSEKFGGLLKNLRDAVLQFLFAHFRVADYIAAQRVNVFIANSKKTSERVRKYYGRTCVLIRPFVDINSQVTPSDDGQRTSENDYYVVLTRLVSWKKVDIAISAANKYGFKLRVVGEGPDYSRLLRMCGESVTMLGRVSEIEKVELLSKARALIQTQDEDFGIVALEAQALGIPVIAFGKGGALETVVGGKTGVFFSEQSAESLGEAVEKFGHMEFDMKEIIEHSQKFTYQNFRKSFSDLLNSLSVYL
jgi:glycosyltransferase involved in cell wall biosynthesis